MTKTEYPLNGVRYVFYGPNATLINWIKHSDLAQAVMDASGLEIETLFRAFSKNNPEDQAKAGKQAIGQLWHACPEFGPYPFLDTLSDFEFSRKFYPDYREHVSHQLRVFWLGLYLFDTCQLLKDRLIQEAGSQDEFIRAWRACAIYHDIGYVLENEGANEPSGEAWKKVRRKINETFHAPLSKLPGFEKKLPEDAEHQVIDDLEIFRPKIKTLRAMEFNKGKDILEDIAKYGLKAGLGNENAKSPFRRYYDYAFSHMAEEGKRPRFRDHGICSAMLLLKTWKDFREYVGKISAEDHSLLNGIKKDLKSLNDRLPEFKAAMERAAGAIALHNITPSIWDSSDTLSFNLTLHNFKIRFHGNGLTPPLASTPMAFLLGLADTLQTWDRPRFRAMRTHDTPGLTDQDMDLGVEDNKIYLFFRDDEEYTHPESNKKSRFAKTCENLKEYLDNQAIDDLLQCGECTLPDEPPEAPEPKTSESASPEPQKSEPEPPKPPREYSQQITEFADRIFSGIRTYLFQLLIEKKRKEEKSKTSSCENKLNFIFRYMCFKKSILTIYIMSIFFISVFDFINLYKMNENLLLSLRTDLGINSYHPNLAIITIEEEVNSKWRIIYSDLINKLSDAGARVVVFDLLFENITKYDSELSKAINEARNKGTRIVVGLEKLSENQPLLSSMIADAVGQSGIGHLCINENQKRNHPMMIFKDNGSIYPSIDLLAAELYTGNQLLQYDKATDTVTFVRNHIGNRDIEVIDESEGRFLPMVNEFQKNCPICYKLDKIFFSYIDVSSDSNLKGSPYINYSRIKGWSDEKYTSVFRDKLVIIGALSMEDQYDDRYGVHFHADAVNSLLKGTIFRSTSLWFYLSFAFFSSLFGIFLGKTVTTDRTLKIIMILFVGWAAFIILDIFLLSKYLTILSINYYWLIFFICYILSKSFFSKKRGHFNDQ